MIYVVDSTKLGKSGSERQVMRQFSKGDSVHNLSDGAPMEVVGFVAEYYLPESAAEGVLCRWQDGVMLFERVYPPESLELAEPIEDETIALLKLLRAKRHN